MSRKSKIIITLGPATESEEMIGKLIDGGTNVFRLNMSHAKHEWAAEMTQRVRSQAASRNANIAVLFDLTGPSIRTGDLEKSYNLLEGDTVEFRKTGVGNPMSVEAQGFESRYFLDHRQPFVCDGCRTKVQCSQLFEFKQR